MKPLVTCVVLSYNHEKFIKEALDGLFSQDYENIEYIISDDNSLDNSYELIQNYLENKDTSNLNIVLNQNVPNLGLIQHLNKIVKQATGEYIILMAGDDISFPNRVSKIVDTLQQKNVSMILSNAIKIDEDKNILGPLHMFRLKSYKTIQDIIHDGCTNVSGATMGCTKEVFTKFGDIPKTLDNEDDNLPVKATLLNGIYVLNDPLLYYRTHVNSLSASTWIEKTFKEYTDEYIKRNNSIMKHWTEWITLLQKYNPDASLILKLNEKVQYKIFENDLFVSNLYKRLSSYKRSYGLLALLIVISPTAYLRFQMIKQSTKKHVKQLLINIKSISNDK